MLARKYKEEDKIHYVEEFKKTNISINGFAKKNNIPVTTFRTWLAKSEDMTFGKIQTNNKQPCISIVESSRNAMIFECDSIKIELQENFNKELLQKIVEVLIHAK